MEPWSVIGVETSNKWVYITNMTLGEGPDVFQGLGYATLQTTRDYVKEHRPTVEKTVRAVIRAQQYIADPANLTDVAKVADSEYGQPGLEVMRLSLERQLHSYKPGMSPAMVDKTGALLLSSASIEAPAPTYADVVDDSFAPLWNSFGR
jgi:NitT/TauT family transport system substrate-binding protein